MNKQNNKNNMRNKMRKAGRKSSLQRDKVTISNKISSGSDWMGKVYPAKNTYRPTDVMSNLAFTTNATFSSGGTILDIDLRMPHITEQSAIMDLAVQSIMDDLRLNLKSNLPYGDKEIAAYLKVVTSLYPIIVYANKLVGGNFYDNNTYSFDKVQWKTLWRSYSPSGSYGLDNKLLKYDLLTSIDPDEYQEGISSTINLETWQQTMERFNKYIYVPKNFKKFIDTFIGNVYINVDDEHSPQYFNMIPRYVMYPEDIDNLVNTKYTLRDIHSISLFELANLATKVRSQFSVSFSDIVKVSQALTLIDMPINMSKTVNNFSIKQSATFDNIIENLYTDDVPRLSDLAVNYVRLDDFFKDETNYAKFAFMGAFSQWLPEDYRSSDMFTEVVTAKAFHAKVYIDSNAVRWPATYVKNDITEAGLMVGSVFLQFNSPIAINYTTNVSDQVNVDVVTNKTGESTSVVESESWPVYSLSNSLYKTEDVAVGEQGIGYSVVTIVKRVPIKTNSSFFYDTYSNGAIVLNGEFNVKTTVPGISQTWNTFGLDLAVQRRFFYVYSDSLNKSILYYNDLHYIQPFNIIKYGQSTRIGSDTGYWYYTAPRTLNYSGRISMSEIFQENSEILSFNNLGISLECGNYDDGVFSWLNPNIVDSNDSAYIVRDITLDNISDKDIINKDEFLHEFIKGSITVSNPDPYTFAVAKAALNIANLCVPSTNTEYFINMEGASGADLNSWNADINPVDGQVAYYSIVNLSFNDTYSYLSNGYTDVFEITQYNSEGVNLNFNVNAAASVVITDSADGAIRFLMSQTRCMPPCYYTRSIALTQTSVTGVTNTITANTITELIKENHIPYMYNILDLASIWYEINKSLYDPKR